MTINVRREFVIFRRFNFLDWACMSPAPLRSTRKVSKFLRETNNFGERSSSLQYIKFLGESKTLKRGIAELLSSNPEEIALTGSSTTQGVQIAFESIKPGKGDNIVTCDLEFTLAGTELQKWLEKGVEIRVLKHRNGLYDLEDLVTLIDKRGFRITLSY